MKSPSRLLACSLLFAAALARNTAADNLILDGTFLNLSYSEQTTYPLTTLYGQVGTDTGSTLTLKNWTTTGYNFDFAPGTADAGTSTGANTNAPNEAPGEYNTGNGYGTTFLWGSDNGGLVALPAIPGSGNFIAADGAYQTGSINQTVTGMTPGKTYAVSFWWAGAQQQSFSGDTTEEWLVSLGSSALAPSPTPGTYQATTPVSVTSHSFSGWMQTTMDFTATSTSEVLSFLASGTPSGEPPFSLLTDVTMGVIPEPSAWMLLVGLGTVVTILEAVRRRRRAACPQVD